MHAIVRTGAIRSPNDFLTRFNSVEAYQFDAHAVDEEQGQEAVAALQNIVHDLDGVWDLCSAQERLTYARAAFEHVEDLRRLGYLVRMGQYRMRKQNDPDLRFRVGIMAVIPHGDDDPGQICLVEVQPGWETLPSDRIPMPPEEDEG